MITTRIMMGAPGEHEFTWEVKEKNLGFGPVPKDCSRCVPDSKSGVLYVSVPPANPGVTCQTDVRCYNLLVAAYSSCIRYAASSNAASIAFPALGTGFHHWTHKQSAAAARAAIEAAMNSCDMEILFCVPEDEAALWGGVMVFPV